MYSFLNMNYVEIVMPKHIKWGWSYSPTLIHNPHLHMFILYWVYYTLIWNICDITVPMDSEVNLDPDEGIIFQKWMIFDKVA